MSRLDLARVIRRRARSRKPAPNGTPVGSGTPLRTVSERPIEHPSVPRHFAATARRHPKRVALRTAAHTVTYGELLSAVYARAAAQAARDSARSLRAVLIPAPLTPGTVAAILGSFASGTTVVAVDPAIPDNRVATITATLREHGYQVSRLDVAADLGGLPAAPDGPADPLGTESQHADVTSIQFTSGSTGTPKAVLHTNGMWLADTQLLNDGFGLADGRRIALCMPISFGGGLNVLFGSLLGGAEIIGVDPNEHSARDAFTRIGDSRAQVITCTPTFIDAMHSAAGGATLPNVERIVATGEPTHARHVRLARELAPHAVFTNWVGSTETGTIASHDIAPSEPLPGGVVPVGIPGPHKKIEISPDGLVSISSRYLSGGYLDRQATAARFTDHADGTTTYMGGDVGRWDENHNLVLSGRADSVVKIRGYLVEPAEIEATLSSYDDIREVAVVADSSGPPTLTAYVSPSAAVRTPSVAELRARLHRDLPPWMVPANIVILAALPRNDRGKVDQSALPRPSRPSFDPPRGVHESAIAQVWAQVLRVDGVGRTDSFYALGGDSLSTTEMLLTLEHSHGISAKPWDLASAPTLADFAAKLAPDSAGPTPAEQLTLNPTTVPLRPISATTVGPPLLCFTGAGASALCFLPLAEQVEQHTPVYAFEPRGLKRGTFPDWSIRRAVARHLTDVRRIQPHGPYTLIGHSLGSHIALEIARHLEADGETVDMVVMLDPWLSPRVAHAAQRELPGATVTLQTDEANGLQTWWQRQKMVPLAGIFSRHYRRRTLAVEEVGMIAGYRHRPQPWPGRALLVQSHLNQDDPRLWRTILTGSLDSRVVQCDHHSIVRPPHIATVLEMIDAARAQTS